MFERGCSRPAIKDSMLREHAFHEHSLHTIHTHTHMPLSGGCRVTDFWFGTAANLTQCDDTRCVIQLHNYKFRQFFILRVKTGNSCSIQILGTSATLSVVLVRIGPPVCGDGGEISKMLVATCKWIQHDQDASTMKPCFQFPRPKLQRQSSATWVIEVADFKIQYSCCFVAALKLRNL